MPSFEPDIVSDQDPLRSDGRARSAHRRLQALKLGLTAVAVVAVVATGLMVLNATRSGSAPPGPPSPVPVAASATAAVSTPPPSPTDTPVPTPTPAPTSSAARTTRRSPTVTVTITVTSTGIVTGTPAPGQPAPAGLDLKASGPGGVTMHADGTRYRGQFTLTATNSGPAYGSTLIYVALPDGVDIDFMAGNPGFGPCLVIAPAPEKWACNADPIPALGGVVHYTVPITANYAPQQTAVLLPGLAFRFTAVPGDGTGPYADPTPADNQVTMSVLLPAV